MIIEIRAKNCFAFSDRITFSMQADMRNKKFATNVYKVNNFNVLKVVGVYGQNNAGKTCLLKCIRSIKDILLGEEPDEDMENIFTDSTVCELGVTFLENGRKFSFDIKYDTSSKEYIYEKFTELFKDQYGNEKEDIWLKKDYDNEEYICKDNELKDMISLFSKNGIICYMVDVNKFKWLSEIKKNIIQFASKIDIIDMNNIPMQKTINLMKNKNNLQQKVVDFIKNSDLYMDDFKFVDMDEIEFNANDENKKPEEKVLNLPENIMDRLRLASVYKGKAVPSILFDSTGTKKIAALAGYIIEGLEQGRILIVDELDSSIHFKLTRAIVALFNNELNTNAQMIFTVHDINLMDCKRLFRKEQIWFVHKDKDGVYVYSLADYTAQQGVRDTTDIIEKYRKGVLRAIPEPDLIKSLLSIKGNVREEVK